MRRILPLLALLSLAFAPAPLPKPSNVQKKPEWVRLPLKRLDAVVVAVEIQNRLGPSGKVVVDVRSNTVFLRGQKDNIDRLIKPIKERDEAPDRP